MQEFYLSQFQDYVKSLNVSKNIENEILDLEFIKKNPSFYIYYPSLFSGMMKMFDQEKINKLSAAGYFYYQSSIIMDTIIDEKQTDKFPIALVCQEETIKLLTEIFTIKSVFWNYWNTRKNEFFNAVLLQQKLYNKTEVNFSEYEVLADYKSAFGKIAVDSIFVLTKQADERKYKIILKSHKYFSVGFQLFDDINDFRIDFGNKQFNWAVYELSKKIEFADYGNDPIKLNKILYIKEIGQGILRKAIEYFETAENLVYNLENSKSWLNVIQQMKNKVVLQLDATNDYLKQVKSIQ